LILEIRRISDQDFATMDTGAPKRSRSLHGIEEGDPDRCLHEPAEVMPDVAREGSDHSKIESTVDEGEDEELGKDSSSDHECKRFLAIHVQPERPANIQIGAAVLDCNTGEVCSLGRTIGWEGDFVFLAGMILDLTKPITEVIVSSKMSESILESLRSLSLPPGSVPVGTISDSTEATLKLKITIIPNAFFDFQSACRLIATKCGGPHALGSVVDIQNRSGVQAVGAVLAHAQRLFPEMPPVTFDMVRFRGFDDKSHL